MTAPPYEALSYVWGDPTFSRSLYTPDNRYVAITASLWQALKDIRHANNRNRLIWADGICMYSYRTATKCCRNLRFRPQFCEGFDSNPQKPVRALGAPLGLGCSCQLHPPTRFS